MWRGVLAAVLLVVATLAATAGAASARLATDPPRLTILGDSVLTAVEWNDAPLATLQDGFETYMDIAVCRRIVAPSCPYEGGRVPTLMDVINALGVRLGPTVLVEVGYNDELATFSQDVDTAIQAMLHAGVQHILWANFPATSNQWVDMDHALEEVASHYGQMTIVDWNGYSRGQGSWFQNDGIHLLYPGALAMATLFNQAVTQVLTPPVPPRPLPAPLPTALIGRPYTAHLAADSGTAPYRWRSVGGPLPRGLRLLANGTISGVPRRAARRPLVLQVTDARGLVATERVTLVVLSGPHAAGAASRP
ncbi:MAG: putative Ig domain-containing protein [Gaiellaceae bacterium]